MVKEDACDFEVYQFRQQNLIDNIVLRFEKILKLAIEPSAVAHLSS